MTGPWPTWREATERALYGPGGFYRREAPAAHFRTSVHASPLFAAAVAELLGRVDAALGRPDPVDLVDVGAGRGELATAVLAAVPGPVRRRLRVIAVERAARPADLPADVGWTDVVPALTGLLIANEWLDDVPLDVAERGPSGADHLLAVDPRTGAERPGPPVGENDARWLARWWPLDRAGARAEIGVPRDVAWAGAVGRVRRGLAVAVDYGHVRGERPPDGTMTSYVGGRATRAVPDGSCDVTAHVAVDAVAAAGAAVVRGEAAGTAGAAHGVDEAGAAFPAGPDADPVILSQRDALRALGVSGARPPRDRASADPAGYLRALVAAGEAGELTDPAGLGAFRWVVQPVGIPPPLRPPATP